MKIFKFSKASKIVLVALFTLGLGGVIYAVTLPTTPDLGVAGNYGVLSSTLSNAGINTAISGDLGYTTGPGAQVPVVTNGSTNPGTYAQAGTDQGTALTALNSQPCTFSFAAGAIDLATDTTHGTIGIYTPGVYCTTTASGAMSIGTAGITLSGAGTYIFRTSGPTNALTTVVNSHVSVADGASACDVFWTPTAATTIGAGGSSDISFKGTVIDAAGITVYEGVKWSGRALAFGGTVTIPDADVVITAPTCTKPHLTVVKEVVGGGSKVAADFPLFVDAISVTTNVAKEVSAGSHTVTETTDSNYTQSFSASCPDGIISLSSGVDQTCTITNTYIQPASSGGGGTTYGCKDPNATNYNFFSSSKPELCVYATITPVVAPPVITPLLPKTGFPPEAWYEFLINSFLNLFR
ncbi:MAG: ice-binding family protein [Candidatus Paceibacterota bacterium]